MVARSNIDLLRSLEVFVGVADSGSMTAAARAFRITQSAISQHIKLLEGELQTSLIDRDRRPLRLTPAGAALRQRAMKLLTEAGETIVEVRQIGTGSLPSLRIAMFATLARPLVPAIVDAVTRRELSVRNVSMMRGLAIDHVRHLLNRDVDIVITSNALDDVEGLERHEIVRERFILALPRRSVPLGATLAEIAAKLPLIRYTAHNESGRIIERHLRRLHIEVPSQFTFDAPQDLVSAVAAGQGWAMVAPTHVVHAIDVKSGIEVRPLPKPGLARTITLVARSGELGDLPSRLAALCRQTLKKQYVPQVLAAMPALADHFAVIEDGVDDARSEA